jgi:hypothetical protein
MSSTARPVEPTAPDAAATSRAYDDAQVKKTDQALSAWRDAFERHHEEQLAREAEQLSNKPKLAPWFLAGATGLALLVAMAAAVARVVAPPSNVSAVSVAPVEEIPPAVAEPSPSALRAPPPPMEGEEVAAPTPSAVSEVVAETTASAPVEAAAPAAAPEVSAVPALQIVGTPRTWDANGYHWVQFEAKAAGPITLTWLDANGQSVLDERTCGFASGDGILGCRVGRSEGRVDVALAKGAAPGDWKIRACSDGNCADVATIAVTP